MCVDLTNLNKARLDDNHPLPKVDILVDWITSNESLIFMDANAGYHQIPVAEKDRIHTTFMTSQGVYCYKIMPFELKNIGATYQHTINKVELYVDNMMVNRKKEVDHIEDLSKTLIKYSPTL